LAAHLLTGVGWSGAGEGAIQSIRCQTRQDGWFFDDVVLQMTRGGDEWRCGCSIKSYAVFGKDGAPREFVKSLLEQWLETSDSGFQQTKDSLTLFSAQHSPDIREAWVGLCDSARALSPEVYAQRFVDSAEPSPMRRAAFTSLLYSDGSNPPRDPIEIARLLRKFRLAEHDFQHAESQTATQAILLCQHALDDSARDRAADLWAAMITYCGGIRRKGGQISLGDLLAELAHRFPLKQHPRYAADWTSILNESRQRMEAMPAKSAAWSPWIEMHCASFWGKRLVRVRRLLSWAGPAMGKVY
jgi:hypothetical protein